MINAGKTAIKIINYYVILVISNLFLCCTNFNNKEIENGDVIIINDSTKNVLNNKSLLDSLLFEAIENKNFQAYDVVYSSYLWKYRDRELLYYSFIMANKHNYPKAYFNIFNTLTFPQNDSVGIKRLDKNTQNLALYYLLKSYELGYKDSKYTIERVYGIKSPIPKSTEYLIIK